MKSLCVFLLIALTTLASPASDLAQRKVVLKEANILKWLYSIEQWEKNLTSYDYEAVSNKKNVLVRAYMAERYCGKGACTHYLFLKLADNNWRLIGVIEGRFRITQDAANGFFDIVASNEIPGMTAKPQEQRYVYDGQSYRAR